MDGFSAKMERAIALYQQLQSCSDSAATQRCDDIAKLATAWLCLAPWVLKGLLGTQALIENRGDDDLARIWQLEKRLPDLEVFIIALDLAAQNARRVDRHDNGQNPNG